MYLMIAAVVLIGVIMGLLAGLIGIGGAVLSTPLLSLSFQHILHVPRADAIHLAISSSVVIMLFTTFSSITSHYKEGNINWGFFRKIIPYVIVGVVSGSLLSSFINGIWLEKIFAIFLFYVAVKFLFDKKKVQKEAPHQMALWLKIILGFIIGFKSGLLGIGGGMMLIPLMLFLGYPIRQVTGTTSAFSFTIALCASMTFLLNFHNYNHGLQIPYTIGYFYLPAIIIMIPVSMYCAKIGARQTAKIEPHIMKKCLAILLLGISSYLLIT